MRCFAIVSLCVFMAHSVQPASAAELSQLKVERADDGVYLTAHVEFDLPPVVEDALLKGIPMFFVVEADIYQSRWYWTDRRVASATRTIRLAFQPLTRRWRVRITRLRRCVLCVAFACSSQIRSSGANLIPRSKQVQPLRWKNYVLRALKLSKHRCQTLTSCSHAQGSFQQRLLTGMPRTSA